jgi:hypothetical protein
LLFFKGELPFCVFFGGAVVETLFEFDFFAAEVAFVFLDFGMAVFLALWMRVQRFLRVSRSKACFSRR